MKNHGGGIPPVPESERVPLSLITPLIRKWEHLYSVDHVETNRNSLSEFARPYVERTDHEGHLAILAFQSGVNARRLRMMKSGKFEIGNRRSGTIRHVDWVPFDIADRIVLATTGTPLTWYQEPLNKYYGPFEVRHYERDREHVEVAA